MKEKIKPLEEKLQVRKKLEDFSKNLKNPINYPDDLSNY